MEVLTHEVVVPGALTGNHEEAEEPVRQQHLNLLVEARQVTLGVVTLIRVLSAPLEPTGRQLIGREGA